MRRVIVLVLIFIALVLIKQYKKERLENTSDQPIDQTNAEQLSNRNLFKAVNCVGKGKHWIGKCIEPDAGVDCVTGGKYWVNGKCSEPSAFNEFDTIVSCVGDENNIYNNGNCTPKKQMLVENCPKCDTFTSKLGEVTQKEIQDAEQILRNEGVADFALSSFGHDTQSVVGLSNAVGRLTPSHKYVVVKAFLKFVQNGYAYKGMSSDNFRVYVSPLLNAMVNLKDNMSETGDTIDIAGELTQIMKSIFAL